MGSHVAPVRPRGNFTLCFRTERSRLRGARQRGLPDKVNPARMRAIVRVSLDMSQEDARRETLKEGFNDPRISIVKTTREGVL